MTARRSWAERALPTLARGLPARHREWVEALRAELAALDDPAQRTAFAASAARAVWRLGFGRALRIALTAGVLAAGVALVGSAAQLVAGGPGVLAVTVPVPALLLFLVGLDAARWGRSFGYGLAAGALALVACLVGVLVVTAVEGPRWMSRHGVFMLDADPPRTGASAFEVAFDLIISGMWVGHVVFWLVLLLIGSGLGVAVGRWRAVRRPAG